MPRARSLLALVLSALAAPAAPAAADQVLTYLSHTDPTSVAGQSSPAQDLTQEYWFGPGAVRLDAGPTSTILRADRQKVYFADHGARTFSSIDLPADLRSLAGPEMAPVLDQMAEMLKPSLTVTPTDRTGRVAGYDCRHYQVELSLGMVQMASDTCASDRLPVDFPSYRMLREAQGEMQPNSGWMKELMAKLPGFPLRSDTTTTMMGSSIRSWQELRSLEERPVPEGHYEPPAGYREVRYDPLSAARRGR